jgi:AcrR family transcriptional regulator
MNSRDNILNAAANIFQEKGYHAASMQDIAEAVDLKKGSLYHHVNSKQEILLALLDEALDLIIERLKPIQDQNLPPNEKLRQLMSAYLTFLTEHRSLSSVLLLEYRSLESDLKEQHIPRRDRVESIWIETIKEGMNNGDFNSIDPGLSTKALFGALNWTITWYREDGPLSPEEISDHLTDLFLEGVLLRRP